jgi:transcription initiation factor TFIIIB Brf1 subunit/transcription initiation factor TFIIB
MMQTLENDLSRQKNSKSGGKLIKQKMLTKAEAFDNIYYKKKMSDVKNKMLASVEEFDNIYYGKKLSKSSNNKNSKSDNESSEEAPIEEIETDWDEILIPDGDCFRSKEVKLNVMKHVISNVAIINQFPNALLLEDTIFTDSDICENTVTEVDTETTTDIMTEENITIDNVWDFVEKMNKESNDDTETLDDLLSESVEETSTEKNKSDNKPNPQKNICKSCDAVNSMIEDSTGSIVCKECGIVNEELLDYSPEWRQYNNDDNRGEGVNRCACPSNFFFPKSSQGTIMSGSNFNRLKRKQKWNSMVYKERSLNHVLEYISEISVKNGIQKIVTDSAKIMYKKLSDCKHKTGPNKGKNIIIRGHNRHSIIAACVFFACVMNENPRSIKEIAKMFALEVTRITKGCKQLFKLMKNCDDNFFFDQLDTSTPEHYIRRYCPKLKIGKADTDLAVRIARNCCRIKAASDHNPHSIAAGSIMLMVDYKELTVEKKQIAELFKTSEVTITKIYNKIFSYIDALVDDDATTYLVKKFNLAD